MRISPVSYSGEVYLPLGFDVAFIAIVLLSFALGITSTIITAIFVKRISANIQLPNPLMWAFGFVLVPGMTFFWLWQVAKYTAPRPVVYAPPPATPQGWV